MEYNGSTLDGLFAQRGNILRPRFLRMIGDILRFNRNAPQSLAGDAGNCSVGHYLEVHGYSREFYADYLQPMVAAIWSAEPKTVADMPLRFIVQFFVNHGLLQLKDRPQWRNDRGRVERVRQQTRRRASGPHSAVVPHRVCAPRCVGR